jgi:hypothetical protein
MGTPGPDRRRVALLGTAAVLAVLAGVAVVLAEDARWLRLGVVAALWTVVLVVIALARRPSASVDAEADGAAEEAADAAEAELDGARRDHERRLAREVGAREEAEREAEKARDEAAVLREQLERARLAVDPVTLRSVSAPHPRPARLRVVGDPGPAPVPTVPPPAPVPAAPAPRSGAAPLRPAPPAPVADPSVLAAGSYVDQYVRSAGYVPEPPVERPSRRGRAGEPPTTGRTVAELLAAHAAAGGTGGRRRRDP